jgi:hypothetical protein
MPTHRAVLSAFSVLSDVLVEIGDKLSEPLLDFRAGKRLSMTGNKNTRVKLAKLPNRLSRVFPVRGEVGRWSVKFRGLGHS